MCLVELNKFSGVFFGLAENQSLFLVSQAEKITEQIISQLNIHSVISSCARGKILPEIDR